MQSLLAIPAMGVPHKLILPFLTIIPGMTGAAAVLPAHSMVLVSLNHEGSC